MKPPFVALEFVFSCHQSNRISSRAELPGRSLAIFFSVGGGRGGARVGRFGQHKNFFIRTDKQGRDFFPVEKQYMMKGLSNIFSLAVESCRDCF